MRAVETPNQLQEKICIFEDGLDDYVIKAVKIGIIDDLEFFFTKCRIIS